MPGQVHKRNAVLQRALGIKEIEFRYYRSDQAHWRVLLDDGEEFPLVTHYFGTESTVLRLAAEKLAKMGRRVAWPNDF